MIDLGLARTARRQAETHREEARRCREVARRQREDSIHLIWHARKLVFDRYGTVQAMWSGAESEGIDESDPPHPGLKRPGSHGGSTHTGQTARKDAVVLVSDTAVRHLFRISVELAGVLELSRDPEVARRIREIISDADELIHEFRGSGAEGTPGAGDSGSAEPKVEASASTPSAEPPSDTRLAMRLLEEASLAIDRSLNFARRQSEKAAVHLEVDLEEASWAVHRALIALTG